MTITLTTEEQARLVRVFNNRIKRNEQLLELFTDPAPRYTKAGALTIELEPSEFDKDIAQANDKRRDAIEFYKIMLNKLGAK